MGECTCTINPLAPPKNVWDDFISHKKNEEVQKCRDLLNAHYQTEYFSQHEKTHGFRCPCKVNRCTNPLKGQRMKPVRILHPPYWAEEPAGRKRVSDPLDFSRRYGEGPNPKPWLSEYEMPSTMCSNKKVNVGRQVDPVPLRTVTHKVAWDPETEMDRDMRCNLWHCRLLHKKTKNDRPW